MEKQQILTTKEQVTLLRERGFKENQILQLITSGKLSNKVKEMLEEDENNNLEENNC